MKLITRSEIRNNRHKVFLFGDNLQHVGLGGQARQCRYQYNAIGIPTKKYPNNLQGSFFTDDQYIINIKHIEVAFNKIPEDCIVVIPEDGLGTGLAQLPIRAPKTYQYILTKISQLEN